MHRRVDWPGARGVLLVLARKDSTPPPHLLLRSFHCTTVEKEAAL